jgi:hypothetical protein
VDFGCATSSSIFTTSAALKVEAETVPHENDACLVLGELEAEAMPEVEVKASMCELKAEL